MVCEKKVVEEKEWWVKIRTGQMEQENKKNIHNGKAKSKEDIKNVNKSSV